MTYIVSSGALNSTHSLTSDLHLKVGNNYDIFILDSKSQFICINFGI